MLSQRGKSESKWFLREFERQLKRQKGDGNPMVDMSTAENWPIRDKVLPILKAITRKSLAYDHLSYASGLGGSKELLATTSNFFNHFFSPKHRVTPEHLVSGAGCSAVLSSLIYETCDWGDGLLVEAPYWVSFKISCVVRNGVDLVEVRVPHEITDPETLVKYYQQAMDQASCRVKGLLFCNPQNPRAQIYPPSIIQALLRFCEEKDIHFISDEIYALSTFGSMDAVNPANTDGSDDDCKKQARSHVDKPSSITFTSVLQIDLEKLKVNPARVHMLYGISKDFGCSGLRLGFCVTQGNPELRMSLAILNNATVSNATSLMAIAILSDHAQVSGLVRMNTLWLRKAALLVMDFLSFHNITFSRPVGGLYIWVKLGGEHATWEQEARLYESCASAGVAVGCGIDYRADEAGWFRLSFALPQPTLFEALRRIEEGMGLKDTWQPLSKARPLSQKLLQWLKLRKYSALC